jgi:hypothetical protein
MQPPRRRRRGIAAALTLSLALALGCGSSGGSKPPAQTDGAVEHARDSAADGHHDALASDAFSADAVIVGHCCALQLGDASTALCQALNVDAAPGLVEGCLPQNTHGFYGRWTCGVGGDPPVCSNNGLNCAVGDPCTLVDVACPGVVQPCDFKPYTPPSG